MTVGAAAELTAVAAVTKAATTATTMAAIVVAAVTVTATADGPPLSPDLIATQIVMALKSKYNDARY